MRRTFLKSKLHRATVTQADLHYEGSISIARDLLRASDILENERVEIYNITNGQRFATYAIEGQESTQDHSPLEIGLNGAAARLVTPGDLIIIASYVDLEKDEIESHSPRVVLLDSLNRPKNL